MTDFMELHDESEVCVVQNDYDDPFNSDRVSFWGVVAWPTIVGNGLEDVWPVSCIEGDYAANDAVPAFMTIDITENGMGDFTVHLYTEEDIVGGSFCMVVTLDEWVQGASGLSHLPHHVKLHLTDSRWGDPINLMAGESLDITHTFTVEPGWDYGTMGVAAWVTRQGGTSVSTCTYGPIGNPNEVLQSRWVPTTPTGVEETGPMAFGVSIQGAFPNPFNPKTTIRFAVEREQSVQLTVHDFSGRQVAELAHRFFDAGEHAIVWNGKDDAGQAQSSGVYFVKIKSDTAEDSQKMVLLK